MAELRLTGYTLNIEFPKLISEDLSKSFESLPLLELKKSEFKYVSATLDELVQIMPFLELESENYRASLSKGGVNFRIGPSPRFLEGREPHDWAFPPSDKLERASADLNLLLLMLFKKISIVPQDIKVTSGLAGSFESESDPLRKWLREELANSFERLLGSPIQRVSGIRVQYASLGRDFELILTYSKDKARIDLRTEASFTLNALTLNLTNEIATLRAESEKLLRLLEEH